MHVCIYVLVCCKERVHSCVFRMTNITNFVEVLGFCMAQYLCCLLAIAEAFMNVEFLLVVVVMMAAAMVLLPLLP